MEPEPQKATPENGTIHGETTVRGQGSLDYPMSCFKVFYGYKDREEIQVRLEESGAEVYVSFTKKEGKEIHAAKIPFVTFINSFKAFVFSLMCSSKPDSVKEIRTQELKEIQKVINETQRFLEQKILKDITATTGEIYVEVFCPHCSSRNLINTGDPTNIKSCPPYPVHKCWKCKENFSIDKENTEGLTLEDIDKDDSAQEGHKLSD